MTKARIQPFYRANNINLGYYDSERVFPRSFTKRNTAPFLYNILFRLVWKSEGVSSNEAIKELKDNFKIVDKFITEENVNSHFEYIYQPKKIQSHLTSFIVYDLETFNTDRAKPYIMTFYRSSKLTGRYERDPTQEELKKSINGTLAFIRGTCVGNALNFCLKLKREEYKDKKGKNLE